MKRPHMLSIYALVFAAIYPLTARAQIGNVTPNPKWAITFSGGVARSGTYDNQSLPGKNHGFFGGGVYRYPLAGRNRALAGAAFGVELGRTVLATSEEFESYIGRARLQSRLWPITLGTRYDLPAFKHLRASFYGAYVPSRQTTALQVPNPYGRGWKTVSPRDLEYYYGIQCLECTSSFASKFGIGASVAFVKQSTNYRGENSGTSWAFPLRYMLYKPDGFTAVTLGVEYKF